MTSLTAYWLFRNQPKIDLQAVQVCRSVIDSDASFARHVVGRGWFEAIGNSRDIRYDPDATTSEARGHKREPLGSFRTSQ